MRLRVQITLLAVVTLATLAATVQFTQAGGAYQEAVSEDVKRQAAVQEDVRHVYADEAPSAFRVAAAQARADALRSLRHDGRLAASEYALASQTAFGLRSAARPDSLTGNHAYFTANLGYDVPRALADRPTRAPEAYGLDPDAGMRDGDAWVNWGLASSALAGLAVLVAVGAANVLRPPSWRRPAPAGYRIVRQPQIMPQPVSVPDDTRRLARFHLAVATLLLLLPLGQLVLAGSEQRAQAEAARRAVQLTTSIVASGQRTAFLASSLQDAEIAGLQAAARLRAAIDSTGPRDNIGSEFKLAAVEKAIAAQLQRMAQYMGRAPTSADRVDADTITALRAQPQDWPAMRDEQNRQADRAEDAGDSALWLATATAVAVIAEFLMAAVIEAGHLAWLRWPLGIAALSVILTVIALL